MEATATQLTDLTSKWILLEAQYHDACINVGKKDQPYDHEFLVELKDRAAEAQRKFERSIVELFGPITLEVVQSRGNKLIASLRTGV